MPNARLPILLVALYFWGCSPPPHDLKTDLKKNFSDHLQRTDSLIALDSFNIVWVDTMTERFGKVIDDSIYTKDYNKIRSLYENATNKDSIDIYKYELDFLAKEVDSITQSIAAADQTRKYGLAVKVFFNIRRSGRSADNYAYYFLDKKGNVLNSELLDSVFIKEAYAKIK